MNLLIIMVATMSSDQNGLAAGGGARTSWMGVRMGYEGADEVGEDEAPWLCRGHGRRCTHMWRDGRGG
jgi:hypothetical protein